MRHDDPGGGCECLKHLVNVVVPKQLATRLLVTRADVSHVVRGYLARLPAEFVNTGPVMYGDGPMAAGETMLDVAEVWLDRCITRRYTLYARVQALSRAMGGYVEYLNTNSRGNLATFTGRWHAPTALGESYTGPLQQVRRRSSHLCHIYHDPWHQYESIRDQGCPLPPVVFGAASSGAYTHGPVAADDDSSCVGGGAWHAAFPPELMRQLHVTEQRVLFGVVFLLLTDAPSAEMLWLGFERLLQMRLDGEIDTRNPAVLGSDWDRSLLLHCLVNTPVGAPRIAAPRGGGTYAWILRYQLLSDLRYLSGDFLHHHGSYENANGNQWPPQFGMMRDDYDSD